MQSARYLRRTSVQMGACFGAVLAADWLVYRRPLGINLACLLLLFALLAAGRGGWRVSRARIAAAVGLAGLVLALVLSFNVVAIVCGMLALMLLVTLDRHGLPGAGDWLRRLAAFVPMAVWTPVRDVLMGRSWARSREVKWRSRGPLAFFLRWGLPALGSLIFIGLFALANPVIERVLRDGLDQARSAVVDIADWLVPTRIVFWWLFLLGAWALLRTRLRGRWALGAGPRAPQTASDDTPVRRPVLVLRCLALFNAVFLVQTGMDLLYLWGGAALPEGMTYAQYAHRGAYPLMATALLAGAFVLATFRAGGAATRSRLARWLVYLWITQNVLLIVSSLWRLGLYVDVYSLTRWRLAALVWMLLVGFGLASLVWRIAAGRTNRSLVHVNVIAAAAVLYGFCFVDGDGLIARYNVAHCQEMTGRADASPLDVAYLESLGSEAIPALASFAAAPSPPAIARQAAAESAERLQTRLNRHLADWRGWTLRRQWLSQRGAVAPARLARK